MRFQGQFHVCFCLRAIKAIRVYLYFPQRIRAGPGISMGYNPTILSSPAWENPHEIRLECRLASPLFQVGEQEVLVGQVTNQLGLALWRNTVAPFKSDFTMGVYVDSFRTGSYSSTSPLLNHCTLASSMIVMADHVVVTPDNVQWGSEPTALQRIASQVPSLILTAVIV
jgi:hypothetical protein